MAPAFRYLNDEMARTVLRAQRECGSHISATARWYCWQSHHGAEFLALAELNRQGFVTHLPMFADRLRKPSRQPGRSPIQPPPILPLFPSYGFVAFDTAIDRWRCVTGTRGIKRLFSFAPERPMPVPVGLVEAIIRRHGPDGYIDDHKPAPRLERIRRGASVELLDGPFAGFPGVCQMSSERRVQLLINVMGRSVTVETDRALVKFVA